MLATDRRAAIRVAIPIGALSTVGARAHGADRGDQSMDSESCWILCRWWRLIEDELLTCGSETEEKETTRLGALRWSASPG